MSLWEKMAIGWIAGLLLLVVCSITWGLQISFNVNGPSCRHIELKDDSGKVIATTTEDELLEPVVESDSQLIAQVKDVLLENKINDFSDKGTVEALIEGEKYNTPELKEEKGVIP